MRKNGFGRAARRFVNIGRQRGLLLFSKPVNVKVLYSFAGENVAGRDEWPGRKVKRTGVELNRNEAFGYAF